MTIDYWQGIGIKDDPTSYRVLESIMSDAWCQNEDFEDFCSNCGYDTDSRKAYRIFASCQKQTEKLKRMLGGDFDTFLHAEI